MPGFGVEGGEGNSEQEADQLRQREGQVQLSDEGQVILLPVPLGVLEPQDKSKAEKRVRLAM